MAHLLAAYSLGSLDDAEFDEVEGHLDRCATCRAEAAVLRDVAGSLSLAAPPAAPPPAVRERLRARVAATSARAAQAAVDQRARRRRAGGLRLVGATGGGIRTGWIWRR